MFADAIEVIEKFTRPIKFITRNLNETHISAGTATLFFVNEDGYAITCKHVAENILAADRLNRNYRLFKADCAALPQDDDRQGLIEKLLKKYDLLNSVAEMKVQFSHCVDEFSGIEIFLHSVYDVALIHFKGYNRASYLGHAVFASDSRRIRPGDTLCRLGFPFPEFSDYRYDAMLDEILWTSSGNGNTPYFPIDGMFTRNIVDNIGKVFAIELSTPGLKGQSGGPLFTTDGLICGVQSMTGHLHLGFDMVNVSIPINGRQTMVNNQPFLHVGQCVNVNVIKDFLNEHHVKHYVGNSLHDYETVNG